MHDRFLHYVYIHFFYININIRNKCKMTYDDVRNDPGLFKGTEKEVDAFWVIRCEVRTAYVFMVDVYTWKDPHPSLAAIIFLSDFL